jgi:arabinose-5-phosphate isomerase
LIELLFPDVRTQNLKNRGAVADKILRSIDLADHTNILKRGREIILAEADAIRRIALDDSFASAIDLLASCKGKVITTGMGKAGNIALKMAGTLCSTGTPSAFLHPGESAHGDLGLLSATDVIVAFSTSGKTREIIEMLERSRRFGIQAIIGITSHPDSRIHDISDVVINMGVIQEPCCLGLTPSASTAVMMAIADALSLVLMEHKQFTKEEYGMRHHGGYLGEKARERE